MFPQTASLKKEMKTRQHGAKLVPGAPGTTGLHPLSEKETPKIENKITRLLPWGLPQAMKEYFMSNPNFFP